MIRESELLCSFSLIRLGLRDLRFPRPLVLMEPKSVSYMLSTNASVRFALLCVGPSFLKAAPIEMHAAQASKAQNERDYSRPVIFVKGGATASLSDESLTRAAAAHSRRLQGKELF